MGAETGAKTRKTRGDECRVSSYSSPPAAYGTLSPDIVRSIRSHHLLSSAIFPHHVVSTFHHAVDLLARAVDEAQ